MVDRERIDELLALLARYVRILRQLADIPLEDYRADPRNFGSAERFLQLAIETTLSVGHHIIAASGFDQPTSYADVFRILGKEGCWTLSSPPRSNRWRECATGWCTTMRK